MNILNQTLLSDLKILTPLQLETLNSAQIISLGDLLSILPRRLDEILAWTGKIEPNKKYSHVFEIKSVMAKKSTRGLPYFLLQISDGSQIFQGFLFSRAGFIINKLRPGIKCGMVVSIFGSNQGVFNKNLVIQKVKFETQNTSFDDLDNQNESSSVDVFYPKMSSKIDTAFLRRVHSRLKPNHYKIDLNGLAPTSLLNSDTLDLYPLHHPNNPNQFYKSLNQYRVLQVFLKTALQKYIVFSNTQNTKAIAPPFDLEWLQNATKKLPVVLTQSQKSAIWEILQEVTVV